MSRITRITLGFAALALALAGCSSATVSATVDGAEIQDDNVRALAGQTEETGSIDGEQFRSALSIMVIQQSLVAAAQADYGIVDLSTDAGREAYLAEASANELNGIASEIQAAVGQGREQSAVEDFVITQAGLSNLVRSAILTDEEFLTDVWTNQPEVLVGVCASHILVATQEEADDVVARLATGEDFAAVAAEVSLDTQSPGGALPCPTPAVTFVPQFAAVVTTAPIGEVSDPIQTEFGFHVVRVDERRSPETLDELIADPAQYVPPQLVDGAYSRWLNDSLAAADIAIRSQIGTWNSQADAIVPPPASP